MILKLRGFTVEIELMWNVKTKVILVVTMAIGPMSESFRK
jgi:hypothetical protein